MGILKGLITTEMVSKIADEGIQGIKEVTGKFVGNYMKRRNVGFGVCSSISGSWGETTQYYTDLFTGKEPINMREAIAFDKLNK